MAQTDSLDNQVYPERPEKGVSKERMVYLDSMELLAKEALLVNLASQVSKEYPGKEVNEENLVGLVIEEILVFLEKV